MLINRLVQLGAIHFVATLYVAGDMIVNMVPLNSYHNSLIQTLTIGVYDKIFGLFGISIHDGIRHIFDGLFTGIAAIGASLGFLVFCGIINGVTSFFNKK